jgi:hypothetical protein
MIPTSKQRIQTIQRWSTSYQQDKGWQQTILQDNMIQWDIAVEPSRWDNKRMKDKDPVQYYFLSCSGNIHLHYMEWQQTILQDNMTRRDKR